MHRLAPFALALSLATAACAQTPQFTDPANLRGERVSPHTGRELPIDQGALGLQQLLRKLNTRESLMLIVAHPDDEDGGMLTLYSRGMGARVADLSLNRGEGGQNAMTGDFEDALGLLRTQELLSADRYSGVGQFFGTEVDFGFSKTKEESFSKWGHDRVLYDVVRSIRLYRPLVIASVFIGGVTDGHGQHQVAGQIAQEAFKAAGDPTVFPDMIAEGILPWQPLKVYARVPTQSITPQGLFDYATNQYMPARFTNYVTGEVTDKPPSVDVVIHEGVTDPLLTRAGAAADDLASSYLAESSTKANANEPLSYVQFARIGLGLQKSQIGPGVRLAPTGAFDIGYHLYGSMLCDAPPSARPQSWTTKTCHPDPELAEGKGLASTPAVALKSALSNTNTQNEGFFDGVDTSVLGLEEHHTFPTNIVSRLAGDIDSATKHLDPAHPQAIAPTLADALTTVDTLIGFTEKSATDRIEKASALHELRIKRVQLNDALVLVLSLNVDATAEQSDIPVGSSPRIETRVKQLYGDELAPKALWLESGDHKRFDLIADVATSTGQGKSGQPPSGQRIIFNSAINASLTASVSRPYFSRDSIEVPVYTLTEPQFRNAPATAPAITAWVRADFHGASIELGSIVHGDDKQPVRIVPPANLLTLPTLVLANADHSFDFSIGLWDGDPSKLSLQIPYGWTSHLWSTGRFSRYSIIGYKIQPTEKTSGGTITASLTTAHGNVTEGHVAIGYGDIPITNYYRTATTRIVPVDLKLPTHRRIGYLPGTGDAVPEALASIGLAPTIVTVADLTSDKLKAFDTVILGVRTYNAHPELHGAPTQALLDFARAGGNVVVQYQSPEFTAADAPYPFSLGSNEKVVDEAAAVTLPSSTSTYSASALLDTPNKITTKDFDGWVEERGHGFLTSWDDRYTALTETHDPGQTPQHGGLITTKLGKGRWTYCAFALYRQLPEAVPGAFRLFVNLLDPGQ